MTEYFAVFWNKSLEACILRATFDLAWFSLKRRSVETRPKNENASALRKVEANARSGLCAMLEAPILKPLEMGIFDFLAVYSTEGDVSASLHFDNSLISDFDYGLRAEYLRRGQHEV